MTAEKTDIVKRLRERTDLYDDIDWQNALDEAADEIERLRKLEASFMRGDLKHV